MALDTKITEWSKVSGLEQIWLRLKNLVFDSVRDVYTSIRVGRENQKSVLVREKRLSRII